MDPTKLYPIEGFTNTVLLKPLVAQSEIQNVIVGEYSYYSDFDDPTAFLERNVLYNFGFSGTALRIGKFCAIAHGSRFVMADANHATAGVSSFPFAVFGGPWRDAMAIENYPFKAYGDIVLGNDVWLGLGVTVMPGVTIGDGAIIGAQSVVTSDIPPYAVAAGNPARVVRQRFNDKEQATLARLCWWDWPAEHIEQAIPILVAGKVDELAAYAQAQGLIDDGE
ncbi:CatB-related O-acetyltransferase [Ferrimonas balearica]|uniref:CatB-related O-acetyltransferase n=1 Tax=Ferrimonas balearica TaxID=44012 RepID=UPI001C9A0286|nr:CatB-related O-acetyltransferase [Ferrimonas balearica]MBY5991781.1 CatB-related O-acetyltransferase [Ferrimonas balearica]